MESREQLRERLLTRWQEVVSALEAERGTEVQLRLNRLAGHVHAIERMLAEGRDCAEVMTQLVAVRAALTQVTMRLMEAHVHTCFTMIRGPEDQPQALEQLRAALAAALGEQPPVRANHVS
jgi:DNA-binding FrmR family transcriptional regulator